MAPLSRRPIKEARVGYTNRHGEVISLRVILDQARNVAELWVPRETPEEMVCTGVQQYEKAYRVVIYRSGTRDLTNVTQGLFAVNL